MERLLLAAALAAVAVVVAWAIQRRQRPAAPVRTGYSVPTQVDRADFDRPEVPWLVVVFTSATCDVCAGVWDRVRPLASTEVVVQEVEYGARRDLHDRYRVEAVPSVLVVGPDGVVMRSFLGPVTAADLWAAVAEAREAGTAPDARH